MPALTPAITASPRKTHNIRRFVCVAACIAALGMAASAQDQGAQSVVLSSGQSAKHPLHIVAKRTGTTNQRPINAAATAPTCFDSSGVIPGPCKVDYYGGPVISNADVVVVYWKSTVSNVVKCGGGTDSHGNCIGVSRFLSALSNSTFVDMLQEYNTLGIEATAGSMVGTASTDQTIGRGTLHTGSPFTITPHTANAGSTIGDANIQNEIQLQITAGTLPAPETDSTGNVNTLYFVYFPPGLVISDPGNVSCVQYCAYHGTFNLNAKDVPYGVIPDFGAGSGCDIGCGPGTQWQNVTSASSHEYAESTTDTGVGLAAVYGPPLAWYDVNNGEIGDPCNQNTDTLQFDSITYTFQQEFSQKSYNVDPNAGCVSPGTVKFTLTAPTSSPAGTPFDVTVKVANSDGSTYVGTVHFTNSGSGATLPSDYTFTTADAGTHKFASGVTLGTSGSQTITAADAHQPSTAGKATVTVGGGKSATTTTLTSSVNPSTYRQPVTFTAVVTATSGSPTGLVTFKDSTSTVGTGTLSGGVASVMVSTLAVGTHSITAAYGGDTNYLSSTSAAHTQTVSKASTTTTLSSSNNPSTFGGSVTFRAIVSSAAGAPPNTEIVKFMDGTTTLGTGSLAAGVASFTTSALTAGTHKIKATYAGDSSYSGSSSLVLSQLVKGLPTTSTVSSNLNPSVYGQTITFKATVVDNSKSGTPTGTVTFKSGTTILAKGIALSGGTASFATSTLAVGIKSITVTYSGDTKYAVSTSAAISQTVTKATSTTTITSSLNPSTVGQSVTFKVSVKPRYAGAPTGTVKLTFGLTVLATVSLANGTASYTTTTLPKGSDVIKATYSGSANFSGSAGSITQTVN